MTSEQGAVVSPEPGWSGVTPIVPPPGTTAVPRHDHGWLTGGGERQPFLSYVEADPSVNWSDELESLHEEASRTHFIDRWTRSAIVDGIGLLPMRATIADVGCSTGYLLEDLQATYPTANLVGIDLITSGLRKAHRRLPAARLLHADAGALPLADASVDAVVSANLLEHIVDDRRALREIARVLRPGARAAIAVPAGPTTYDYYDRFLGHQRRYGRGELAAKCAEVGLEPVEDVHIAALLHPAFWLVKQRNRLRYDHLRGAALQARVASDIFRTRDSRAGYVAWRLERRLARAGVRLPFGIRSLVVARRGTRS
jgi:SAM-dependent methyltransferase